MFERKEISVASGDAQGFKQAARAWMDASGKHLGRLSSVWQRKGSMLLSCVCTECEKCSLAYQFELAQNEMIVRQAGASWLPEKKKSDCIFCFGVRFVSCCGWKRRKRSSFHASGGCFD